MNEINSCRQYDIGLKLQNPLLTFNSHARKAFSPVNDDSRLYNLSYKISIIVLIIPIYSFFALFYIAGKKITESYFKEIDLRVKNQIKEILLQDKIRNENLKNNLLLHSTQPSSVKQELSLPLIKQGRYAHPERELNRLKDLGVLTPHLNQKIDSTLEQLKIKELSHRDQIKILIAQAIEIKELYKETHYTFTHAQHKKWTILSYLTKSLVKKFHPEKNIKQFKFVRSPDFVNPTAAAPNTFKDYIFYPLKIFEGNREDNVKNYLKSNKAELADNKLFFDHLPSVRSNLLSVDAFFLNQEPGESALFFLTQNKNMMSYTIPYISKLLLQFVPHISQESMDRCITTLSDVILLDHSWSNLYTFCIPKETIHEVAYRSHPYGIPCTCPHDDELILTELQKDNLVLCAEGFVPQYRIYTPLLRPNSGQKVFLHTSLTRKQRQEAKATIRNMVEEICNQNLPA